LSPVTNASMRIRVGDGAWVVARNDGLWPDSRALDGDYSASIAVPGPAATGVLLSWEIAAPGKSSTNGATRLLPIYPPSNDDFDRRVLLTGTDFRLSADLTGATREVGEPWHNGLPMGNSIWYAWVAPADGYLSLYDADPARETVFGLYTGISVGSLESVKRLYEPWHEILPGVEFPVRSNAIYALVVEDREAQFRAFEIAMRFYPGSTPRLPPQFLVQPVSRTVEVGTEFTFISRAIAPMNPAYTWYFNGNPVPFQTGRDYLPRLAQYGNAGAYWVVASNAFGAVTSAVATLTVVPATTISNLFDDFEPSFDGTQWARLQSGLMATNYGGAVSGQNSLWFDPYYNFLPLQTRAINTVNGGMIRFWLRCGDGSTLNWLPPGSHVQMNLHFSTTTFPNTLVAAFPSSSYPI